MAPSSNYPFLASREPPPAQPCSLSHLQHALQNGAKLHAFLSGGGLRVVRLEKGGKLLGYGEHPYIEESLRHADEDTEAGGRPYAEVYGGKYDHYLTGSSTTSSDLDRWMLQGRTFDVTFDTGPCGGFVAKMVSIEQTDLPQEIECRVAKTGVKETFINREFTYEASRITFANGEFGTSIKTIGCPAGKSKNLSWMWDAVRVGYGDTIRKALANALAAEPQEVEK